MNKIKLIVFSSSLHDGVSVIGSRNQLFEGIRAFAELEMAYPSTLASKSLSSEAFYDGATEQSRLSRSDEEKTVCFIATGGTEEIFRQYASNLPEPVLLLCDGFHNSFAATLEISSFLAQEGIENKVFTAPLDYSGDFFREFEKELFLEDVKLKGCGIAPEAVYSKETMHSLAKNTIGLIGGASSWLISSAVDRKAITEKFGVKFVDIELDELINEYSQADDSRQEVSGTVARMERFLSGDRSREDLKNAARMYSAMKSLCSRYSLTALTIKCFGILDKCHTTACLALSLLNDDGIVCACEGDIPALWSMIYAKSVFGGVSFMANPASANRNELTVDFAHCTIPLSMVHGYRLPSHFESSIGIGIAGSVPCGRYRLTKITGNLLDRLYTSQGEIIMNTNVPQRCRTQIRFRFDNAEEFDRFLSTSKGNHIIISKF